MQLVTITKTQVAKVRVEPKTIGTASLADLKRIRYATRMPPLEWQTDHFI